jgi:hypothetical protein
MPDLRYWSDEGARQEWIKEGRRAFERIQGQLCGEGGVVAVEPDSGDYFVGPTLGKANDAAYARHPDRWLYFVRLDDPAAEIILPTW